MGEMDGQQGKAVAADSGDGAAMPVNANSSAGEASVKAGVDGAHVVPAAAPVVAQSDSSPSPPLDNYEGGGTGSSSSKNTSAPQTENEMPPNNAAVEGGALPVAAAKADTTAYAEATTPSAKSAKRNNVNAKGKTKTRRAVTTLGRDGLDYQHVASPSSSHIGGSASGGAGGGPRKGEAQQAQRSKWRPPTPERVRHQEKKKTKAKRGAGPSTRSTSGLLTNLGGGSSHHDNNSLSAPSASSWFGGFFSSSSSAGTAAGSSSAARFTALDGATGMHPEQIATDAAIARANDRRRRQRQRHHQTQVGTKKRSKLIRKGDRHLLQQSEEGGIHESADGNVLMTQAEMDEAEDNFQDELDTNNSSSSSDRVSLAREEQIRNECNFFYTGMDDDPTAKAAELRRARNSATSRRSRLGYRDNGGGGRRRLMATDGGDYDDDNSYGDLESGDERGLYYAASGEDGAMGLDLEAGGYYSNNAEERDAFLARHESLNAYVKPPPSRHKRRGRFSGGIHTAVLPGDDHDLRLDQDGGPSPASPSSSRASSPSVYSSAVSSLHSLAREGGAMQLDEPPPSPSSVAIVSDSLRQSSLLYIHAESGMVQLRLPTDKVRLLMDPHLEPGILSVERVRVGKDGKTPEDGIAAAPAVPRLGMSRSRDDDKDVLDAGTGLESYPTTEKLLDEESSGDKRPANKCPWKDEELHYVLTVDDDLYRRLVKEMADSRTVCGIYYCCHTTEGDENRVSIGVALCVLFVVFTLLLVETIIHPH